MRNLSLPEPFHHSIYDDSYVVDEMMKIPFVVVHDYLACVASLAEKIRQH